MSSERHVLIVEDNDDDFEACVVALRQGGGFANPIRRCETGDEAIDIFRNAAKAKAERPALVILDLSLPGSSGFDVLRQIKTHETTKPIPVVVMSGSRDPEDIDACYRSGANSYVAKPTDLDRFFRSVAGLRDYWFKLSHLPAGG